MTQDFTANPLRGPFAFKSNETSRTSVFYYLLYISILAYFVARYILAHHYASFTFPVPWPDESSFLWQALSFQESSSLFAPQLHPARPILWMPPGYMVITGTIFKLFGFSLGFARGLSMVFIVGTFLVLLCMTLRYDLKLASLLICGAFFVSTRFIIAGNIARMEALLLFVVFAGFHLMQGDRAYKGLSLLSVTPLIHPNGAYFFAAAIILFLLSRKSRYRELMLTKSDWAFVVFSVALWGLYAFYAYQHWPAFRNDMGFQFGLKLQRDILGSLLYWEKIRLLAIAVFCWVYSKLARLEEAFLLYIAIPSLLVNSIGHEIWYEVFDNLSYLLVSIVALHVLCHLVGRAVTSQSKALRGIIVTVVAFVILFYNIKAGVVDRPLKRPFKKHWEEMQMPAEVPYITEFDINELREFLTSLKAPHYPIRVEFFPRADALFFHDLGRKTIQFHNPVWFGRNAPDVFVVHISTHLPWWQQGRSLHELGLTGISPSEKGHLLRKRDSTETWSYVLVDQNVTVMKR